MKPPTSYDYDFPKIFQSGLTCPFFDRGSPVQIVRGLGGRAGGIDLMTTKNAEKLSCGHPDFFDWLDGSLMVFIDVFDGI